MQQINNRKIALNELGGAQWTGGITYRNNLLKALQLLDPNREVYFISKNVHNEKQGSNLKILSVANNNGFVFNKLDKFAKKFLATDLTLRKTVKSNGIDVLFPASLNVGSSTAVIYWIPDFQFVHLPHLYTKQQIKYYDVKLKKYFKDANLIIVSSEDALADFKKFSPEYISKVRVMRFVAHVPDNLYNIDPSSVLNTYNLPAEFIYLPNQFWAHKNHDLVLEALKILKDRGIKPFIVCSGNPVDVRDPLHLAKLLQQISELGLRDQIAMLGLIPHKDVYALIRQSKCVLNPSLFEGWSTSVEEAKSVGKRMILSDLNVHKEQNPLNSFYFNRYDATDLALKLEQAWNELPAGADVGMETAARSALTQRMKDFALNFLNICEQAVQLKRTGKL